MSDNVFPEDSGTGGYAAGNGDYDEAANFASLADAVGLTDYVVEGLNFTLNASTPSLDVSQGKAVVSQASTTGAKSGDTRDNGVAFVAELDARSGLSLTDSDINHVFLSVDLSSPDTINIIINTTNSAPADPYVKLGTVDTTNDTTTELNRLIPIALADLQSKDHSELTGISSDQHHTKTSSASELTDVSADSVSDAHHAKYTDENAQDAVGGILSSDFTYDDAGNLIDLASNSVTVANNTVSLGGSTAIAVSDLSDVTSITGLEENTSANRPAAGTEGRIFFETDTGKVLYDNGTSWIDIGVSDHSQLSGIGSSDHHARPVPGQGLVENTGDFDVRLDIDDSGTNIAQAYGINFGTNLDVTDDTDNTVTVDVAGTLGHSISDSGTEILAEPGDVNFGADFNVTDDGDGSATVTLEGTLNPNEVVFPGSGTGATSALPTSKTSGQYAVQDQLKFGSEGSATTSTSYTTIVHSDIAHDFDKLKDRNGQVYVNFIYHVRGDVSARIYRQNAGTAVTGSAVSGTAGSQTWTFQESGWIDFSAETGFESYQVQLRSDDGSEVGYNSIIMMVATPQG